MITKVSIRAVDIKSHNHPYMFMENGVTGLDYPSIRTAEFAVPEQHGGHWDGSNWGTRKLRFQFLILSATEADYQTKRLDLQRAIDLQKGSFTMYVETSTGGLYQLEDCVIGPASPDVDTHARQRSYTPAAIEVTAYSPYILGQTLKSIRVDPYNIETGIPIPTPVNAPIGELTGGGGSVDASNLGTTKAYPLIYIYGPGSIFTLTNLTTGETLTINRDLTSTEYILIDTRPTHRGVKLGGFTPVPEVFSGDYITLTDENGGSNVMRLTVGGGDTADTHAQIEYRDTFGGL